MLDLPARHAAQDGGAAAGEALVAVISACMAPHCQQATHSHRRCLQILGFISAKPSEELCTPTRTSQRCTPARGTASGQQVRARGHLAFARCFQMHFCAAH